MAGRPGSDGKPGPMEGDALAFGIVLRNRGLLPCMLATVLFNCRGETLPPSRERLFLAWLGRGREVSCSTRVVFPRRGRYELPPVKIETALPFGLFRKSVAGLFVYREETSLSLRLIVLATGWWVGLSLGWLGTPVWVWAGIGALLTAGHAFNWYFGHWKSPVRSLAVGLAMLGILALAPGAVGRALAGDWLAFAHFLLLFQAVTAFELKTRGGLYAGLGLSGVILFIGSQRALDPIFGVFMIGFVTLLLAFLAMSFLVDQVRRAEVRWFASRFAFAWFWSGMLIVCLAVSAAIFILLPKQLGDPITEAHAVLLPIGASESGVLPEVTGE